jgi:hypothetical protein
MSVPPQYLPEADFRVDTGVLQIGEDWPGYFMRGDFAIPLATSLTRLMSAAPDTDPTIARLDAQRLVDLTISLCRTHELHSPRERLIAAARAAGEIFMHRFVEGTR